MEINRDELLNVDQSIKLVQDRVRNNEVLRESLVNKIATAIKDMTLATGGKELIAQTELMLAFNSVLDSTTKDHTTVAKLLLSKKTSEDMADLSKNTVSILRQLKGIESIPNPVMSESDLRSADELLDKIETDEILQSVISN